MNKSLTKSDKKLDLQEQNPTLSIDPSFSSGNQPFKDARILEDATQAQTKTQVPAIRITNNFSNNQIRARHYIENTRTLHPVTFNEQSLHQQNSAQQNSTLTTPKNNLPSKDSQNPKSTQSSKQNHKIFFPKQMDGKQVTKNLDDNKQLLKTNTFLPKGLEKKQDNDVVKKLTNLNKTFQNPKKKSRYIINNNNSFNENSKKKTKVILIDRSESQLDEDLFAKLMNNRKLEIKSNGRIAKQ